MLISEYWKNLDFSYLKTYSGLRSGEIDKITVDILNEISALGKRIKRLDEKERPFYEKRLEELKKLVKAKDWQVIKHGSFHKSAREISCFKKEASFSEKLGEISKISGPKTDWMCGPVFRDALVFFNEKNEIVALLQICFSCDHLINEKEEEIIANEDFFKALKELFLSINHPIDI